MGYSSYDAYYGRAGNDNISYWVKRTQICLLALVPNPQHTKPLWKPPQPPVEKPVVSASDVKPFVMADLEKAYEELMKAKAEATAPWPEGEPGSGAEYECQGEDVEETPLKPAPNPTPKSRWRRMCSVVASFLRRLR